MNIVRNYCLKNFPNFEENILKIIESDLDDELELVYIRRETFGLRKPINPEYDSFKMLIDKKLLRMFQEIDYIYVIEIHSEKEKLEWILNEKLFDSNKESQVYSFLSRMSVILLMDHNKEFREYLINKKNYTKIMDYGNVVNKSWRNPKFNIIEILMDYFPKKIDKTKTK